MANSSINIFNSLDFVPMLYNQKFLLGNNINFNSGETSYKNDYKKNNYNFRDDKDIIKGSPADILAIGCSNTVGIGVPFEHIWSSVIKKQTGLSVANLGVSGGSTEQIISFTLKYIDYVN